MYTEQECKTKIEEINILMRPMLAELKKLRDIKRPITEKLRALSRQREKNLRDERKQLKAAQCIEIIHMVVGGMSVPEAKEALGLSKYVVRDLQGAWFKMQYGVESTNHFSCPTWQITKDIRKHGIQVALQHHKPSLAK
tara:strand:- start:109 stop:525 length:417 start_codon:yes stop_codon:yes gene_type:complete